MIKIVVFIDWLIYYYIDTTQRDGSFQKKIHINNAALRDVVACSLVETFGVQKWGCISIQSDVILKMEAAHTSQIIINFYFYRRRYFTEENILLSHRTSLFNI